MTDTSRPAGSPTPLERWALLIGSAGLLLAIVAPAHRPDLLVLGLAALLGASLARLPVALFLVGAALPFFFFDRRLIGPLSVSPPGLALMAAWLAALLRAGWARVRRSHDRSALAVPRTGYDGPLLLFLLGAVLSLTVTEYPLLSVRELRAVVLEPVLFFWLVAALRRDHADRWALAGFLGAALVTAVLAIAQVAVLRSGTAAEGVLRAQAWYPSPNHLALMLGRALPFLVAAALARPEAAPAGDRLTRAASAVAAALVGLALLLTFSLGGWLGAAAAVVATTARSGRGRLARGLAIALVGSLLVISVLAVAGRLPERLNPARQTSGFRIELWDSSLHMARDHPLLGVGADNFVYLYQQVYLQEGAAAEPNLSHPHNWILHVWLELGLAGLAGFLWLLWRFWRRARTAHPPAVPPWIAAGAVGSMADLVVHGLVDNSYFLVDLAFVFWLCLALVRDDGPRSSEVISNDPVGPLPDPSSAR